MSRASALVLMAALLLTGCDALAGAFPNAAPTPQPCGRIYKAVQCSAITDAAALQLETTREDVVSIDVVPGPTPEVRDGVTILPTLGGAPRMNLLVTLADGTTRQVSMCGGVSMEPQCVVDPHLIANTVTQGGYHDVPEGSSPVPSAAADALADATGLRIDRLDIPIDHTGLNEIVLGEARLPNGLLTTADFELVDGWPAALSIVDGRVTLEVRSQEDGKPIQNIYEHGWRTGIEGVDAVLVFEVFRFEPGATLSIRDVVVR
ncbi:MAG: hypothetical protein ACXW4L_00590 [Candidatus Limnocylindrales bacterium]